MIETSQLLTLQAVARVKSFSKAAKDLGVTQSAISQSVKNLENKVSVKLFKRSGKQVVLTPEGEKLYSLANDYLENMASTLTEIKEDKDSMSGPVRIGTLTGVGKAWLAQAMCPFSEEYDELVLSVNMGFREELITEFENYRLDILVLPEAALPNVGEKFLLGEEKCTLVFPKTEEYNFGDDITMDDIYKHPAILFEKKDRLFESWCQSIFGEYPKKVKARYIVNSHGSMLHAVRLGLGMAVVPQHVLASSYYKEKVGTLGPKFNVSNAKVYVVYHKESSNLARIKKTLEWLKNSDNPFQN